MKRRVFAALLLFVSLADSRWTWTASALSYDAWQQQIEADQYYRTLRAAEARAFVAKQRQAQRLQFEDDRRGHWLRVEEIQPPTAVVFRRKRFVQGLFEPLEQVGSRWPKGRGSQHGSVVTPPDPESPDSIAIVSLLEQGDAVNATSYQTAAFTCPTGAVCVCAVASESQTTATTPTLTQTGQTWTAITSTGTADVSFGTVASPDSNLKLFRTLGAGATAAAATVDFGATTQDDYSIACYTLTGVDLGGANGANAIQQAVGSVGDTQDPFTVTLAALQSQSAVLMVGATASGVQWTVETGYTGGTELSRTGLEMRAQWHLAESTDATPTWDWNNTANVGAIGLELKAGTIGDSVAPDCDIDTPTISPDLDTSTAAIVISGTCTDAVGVADNYSVTCPECAAVGTISGTTGTSTTFSVTSSTMTCSGGGGTVNTFTITGRDAATLAGTDVLTVTCRTPDNIAPTGAILSPVQSTESTDPDPVYNTSTQALIVSGQQADVVGVTSIGLECITTVCVPDTVTCTISGAQSGTFTCPTFNLAAGTNVVRATLSDAAANSLTIDISVVFTASDVTAPVCTISQGAGPIVTTTTPTTISGTCTDAVGVTGISWATAGVCGSNTLNVTASTSVPFNFTVSPSSGVACTVTVTGSDQAGNMGTDSIQVQYTADLVISTTTLPSATQSSAYNQFLQASGGAGNRTWDNNSGGSSLGGGACTGLSITTHTDNQQGKVSGTPTTTGTCSFTAKVTDSQGTPDTDTQALSIVVNAAGAEARNDYFNYQVDNRSACSEVVTTNCIVQLRGNSSTGTLMTATAPGDNGAASLRNHQQLIDAGRTSSLATTASGTFNYVFGTGDDAGNPDPQDAAKLKLSETGNGAIQGSEQLKFFHTPEHDAFVTLTYIIDDYFSGPAWLPNGPGAVGHGTENVIGNCTADGASRGAMSKWKHYRIDRQNSQSIIGFGKTHFGRSAGPEYWQPDVTSNTGFWDCSDGVIAVIGSGQTTWTGPSVTQDAYISSTKEIGAVTGDATFEPAGQYGYFLHQYQDWPIKHSKWGRFIGHLVLRVPADNALFDSWRQNCDQGGTQHHILSSSTANPTVITTRTPHNLSVGNTVVIRNHPYSTPMLDGVYTVNTVPTSTTFTVDVNVTAGSTKGGRSNGTVSKVQTSGSDSACANMLQTIAGYHTPVSDAVFHAFSSWRCDEDRPCQRLEYRIPSLVAEGTNQMPYPDADPGSFRIEINSSTSGDAGVVNLTYYNSNLIVIKNINAADIDDLLCPGVAGAPSTCAGDVGAVNSNIFRKPVR